MEFVASLSQGPTAAAQCGLFTYKSVPVIFEPPCIIKSGNRKRLALLDTNLTKRILKNSRSCFFANSLPTSTV